MDPWREYAAWHECRDVARRWAELEGKSATMSNDLRRGLSPRQTSIGNSFLAIEFSARVVAGLVELWRLFRSG